MTSGGHTATRMVGGRYRLVERLGSGGMGTVWRAYDTGTGAERALKEIRIPDNIPSHDRELLVERAHREARNAARLGIHPNVVTVYGLVEDHGTQWIVMDLVPGRSLAAVIAQEGALSEREVARIGIALLDALVHGHRRGVLHRDVKPSNVLITADGTVRLVDFGIAAFETDNRITAAGGLVGTPAYMAPERIRGGDSGPESDLFSLATTLIHAAEGASPFERDTTFATMHAVVYEGPSTPVRAARTQSVLQPMLAKNPSDRPSADRLRRQLQAVLSAPLSTPDPQPASTVAAWPTASAFYEAPTMHSLTTMEHRPDAYSYFHDELDTGELPATVGTASRTTGGSSPTGMPSSPEELNTVGLKDPATGVPKPRRSQPQSAPDIDPATIEQPAWTGAAPKPAPGDHDEMADPDDPPRPSRRGVLLAAVAVAGLGAGGGTAAWAARRIRRPATAGTSRTGLGPLAVLLPATRDVEFAGSFIADNRGYYRRAGFTRTEFRDSGPDAATVAALASGKAFVGVASPDTVAREISGGARLRVIGTQRQKSPWAIVSLADRPIRTPQEMIGTRIGIAPGSVALWTAFLSAAGVPETEVTKVVTADHAQAVADRRVDGVLSSLADAPVVLARQGFTTSTFLLADHRYPLVSDVYVVAAETINTMKGKVKAFLSAEIRGWRDSLADPMLGARLTTDVYAKSRSLDVTEQLERNKAFGTLVQTEETRRNGLFTMTDALIEANIRTLSRTIPITARQMFDLSILRQLYTERPDLI
ncbi:ABC transporter substrate-binding protein [Frankia sp. Cppng1_Ct_nod]|uniref:protein kinase domain-containing protein n=1 Tax=Frankia sp. Cppng1_Ct_nod TaxID=2897162 RepID=UPI002025486B|nr:ABC transporter substrate-binding protein [Frankia sp. Cppng1_Ct_nod]